MTVPEVAPCSKGNPEFVDPLSEGHTSGNGQHYNITIAAADNHSVMSSKRSCSHMQKYTVRVLASSCVQGASASVSMPAGEFTQSPSIVVKSSLPWNMKDSVIEDMPMIY